MGTHKSLDIWKQSIDLVERVYKATLEFPDEEKFGLVSQIRKAAISIPSNIAEGAARQSDKENIYFLYIALASLSELDTQFIIAKKLDICNNQNISNSINTLRPKIVKYIKYLKTFSK
ncbi:four helix bundle protein [Fidelibacter multiformis]|uniref:four helix bundle protein n=1 Tax=Fidelibacter multiformis TaxID=3377529 RepID=UPI0037DCB98E